jgi:hypothetical protein
MVPGRTTCVVLAAAHLDHDPSHNRLRNLKSQRCRLLHDRPYHRAQRWITFRRRYATGDLFLGLYALSQIGDDATEIAQGVDAVVSPLSVMHAFVPQPSAADDRNESHNSSGVLSSRHAGNFEPSEFLI